MNTRWFLAAIVSLSLLAGNLVGANSPQSMPSAAISARPVFPNPINMETAELGAGWTATMASLPPIQNIAAIAAGYLHTCALTTAGGVKCWGGNYFGQLGDGTRTDHSTPVDVVGLASGVAAIAAGGSHTCALLTAGGAKCWGYNWYGQLGDGTRTDRSTPVDVAGLGSGVAAIAAGGGHSCALLTTGGVKCWGNNESGQLGDGTATSIAAGGDHTCALLTTGGVKCWGDNGDGQLGDGTTTQRSTPVDVVGLASGVAAIDAGSLHTCALLTAGGVKCWGDNWYGQLGDGTRTERWTPVDVVGLASGAASIAAGGDHESIAACGDHTFDLLTTGGVKCWGVNWYGQLGDGTTTQHSTPVDVVGLGSGVAAVAAGGDHTCALLTTGGVKCWGWNYYGQLGDGTTAQRSVPVDVVGLGSGVAAIAACYLHTCALTTINGAKCWGWNEYGQLGDGTTTSRSTPVDVVGLGSGVAAIAAGEEHTCALLTTGGVKCWGRNRDGQLGDGTTSPRITPVDVVGLASGAAAVAAGYFHTCALLTTGGVKCWGGNWFGQLGDGTTTDRSTPVDVVGLGSGAAAIAAGEVHTCALLTTGGVKCWGYNGYGQLGDGTRTQRSTPVDVVGLGSGAAAIAAGGSHTCALLTTGGVKCWGRNEYGQLGDGTTTQRSTPVDVVGLGSGTAAIAAGYGHTCALLTAGGVKCWGADHYGQLGLGTTIFSATPIDVVTLLKLYLDRCRYAAQALPACGHEKMIGAGL